MDMDMSQHSSLDFCQQYEYTVRLRDYWHIEVEFTAFVKCKAKPNISILSAFAFIR